jgi:hypothetical protein
MSSRALAPEETPRALAQGEAPRALAPGEASALAASLFLDPRPELLERLRLAAERQLDWKRLVPALERHGILCLARRNLDLAGVSLPTEAAELEQRDLALREDAGRFAFTLERMNAALNARGIEPTLLKGASLLVDLYADPAWRSLGDLDLLVEPGEVRDAVGAAADLGVAQTREQFPLWWYSLTHFHVQLEPQNALLRPVEIHWALHPPALLYTVTAQALRERRVPVELAGARAFALGRIDRLLHLATHLTSHWIDRPSSPAAMPPRAIAERFHPVRLKWALDLMAEIERMCRLHSPREVHERAAEWSAQADLAWILGWIRGGGMLSGEATDWMSEWMGEARSQGWVSIPTAIPPAMGQGPGQDAGSKATSDEAALPAFGFRTSALRRLPRWIFPPAEYIARRYRIERPHARAAMRVWHAALVLGRGALALYLFPAAWLGRFLVRRARLSRKEKALEPEHILDLVSADRRIRKAKPQSIPHDPAST